MTDPLLTPPFPVYQAEELIDTGLGWLQWSLGYDQQYVLMRMAA
jgi:hypothetical protein